MKAKQPRKNKPTPRPPKVVKRLAPGMRFEGTVRDLTDFGAFVDIGVGRDGLVHVTEISREPVSDPGDVLRKGDKVNVWVKDLDRERNRISLTMIDPDTPTVDDLREGDVVRGRVVRLVQYGAFVDIGVEREALLHVREMGEGYVARPEDVVRVGDEIEARVASVDPRRKRVDISLKGLGEEAVGNEDLSFADDEEDAPTVMQVAMEEALRRQENPGDKPRQNKRKPAAGREELDDIIRRTLESHRES